MIGKHFDRKRKALQALCWELAFLIADTGTRFPCGVQVWRRKSARKTSLASLENDSIHSGVLPPNNSGPCSLHHISTPHWVSARRPRLHFQLTPAGPTGMFCSNRKWNPHTSPCPPYQHDCPLGASAQTPMLSNHEKEGNARIRSKVGRGGHKRRGLLKRARQNKRTGDGRRSVDMEKMRHGGRRAGDKVVKERSNPLGEKRRQRVCWWHVGSWESHWQASLRGESRQGAG